MADIELIKPSDLPAAPAASETGAIPIDNGTVVQKATPKQVVDAGRPFASQAQAEAGDASDVAMSPLTTRQAIEAQVTPLVQPWAVLAEAWAESVSPPNPADPTSKSSKSWAELAQISAEDAEASAISARFSPQSWSDFQTPKYLTLPEGVVLQFNGVQFVRDSSADINGLGAGEGWSPYDVVTPLHFTNALMSDRFRSGLSYASAVGKTFRIPAGDYEIATSASFVMTGSLHIEFDPGAKLIATSALFASVINARGISSGSAETFMPYDLVITNPNIDCSAGGYIVGAGSCTGISFSYVRNVTVYGGFLYGSPNFETDPHGDSGISWVTCGDVNIIGTVIDGFADAGIYPGGNNDTSLAGDGETGKLIGVSIRRCAQSVTAKRQMKYLQVIGGIFEECNAGISTQNVGDSGGVPVARRMDIVGATFRKIRANMVRFRGSTKGTLKDCQFEDWGFYPDGSGPAGANAVAVNLDGSVGIDLIGNSFSLKDFPADNQAVWRFSQHSFDGQIFNHGKCFGSGNSYRGIPRVYVWESAGDAHTFLGDYLEAVGANAISGTNMNANTLIEYRQFGAPNVMSRLGNVYQKVTGTRYEELTASKTLTAADGGSTYSNPSATTAITLTLPPAATGLRYRFNGLAMQNIGFQAVGNDVIRLPGAVSSTAAGSVTCSNARGSFIELEAVGDANWICIAIGGTWTAA